MIFNIGKLLERGVTKTMNSMDNYYQNFRVAIYLRALDLEALHGDITPFKERFHVLSRHVKVDKVYVETHRDLVIPDETTLIAVRDFLKERGVQVSGGITVTIKESDNFKTYCYSNPKYRQKLKEVVILTARLFDEIIFDDFFFTNCKCPLCITAKGEKSWTRFRLAQMTQASKELALEPARSVNSKVKVIIKYPNWYEHFQGLGFNLQDQPPLYDGVYTGNETRDPVFNTQHLQPYESYLVFGYFENIKPGGNCGGWVDPFGIRYLDRYAEQLWLTLFSKAPEITLFDYRSIQIPIKESHRAPWQGQGTSFNFDAVTAPVRQPNGDLPSDANMALAAGAVFEQVDKFLGKLGNPIGVKSYKPYHSRGEDFLHNYLGMLGIPLDLVPEFPVEAQTVLLTESAKGDPEIVTKIKRQLMNDKTVVITTGLLRALQGKGLEDIVEMEYTNRKQTTSDFLIGWNNIYSASKPILVPIVHYMTNDSWEEISCMGGTTGTPLLHSAAYGRSKLYVLTIPDNFDDLYYLPKEVLTRIKEIIAKDLFVRIEAPAQVSLFVYDNGAFIAESFLDNNVDAHLVLDEPFTQIQDILSGEVLSGKEVTDESKQKTGKYGFDITIKPHSFRVFQAIKN
jgi:hypothetical protein